MFLAERAMEAALAVSRDEVSATVVSLAGTTLGPCTYCLKCRRLKGECVTVDDFQHLRDLWMDADAIVYSAPVFHMGLPGQLRCFMDRLGQSLLYRFPEWPQGPKLLKTVGAIAQGMHMAAGQEQAIAAIVHHALIMGCVPVAGDGWQSYIGAGGWTCDRESPKAIQQLCREKEAGALAVVAAAESVGRRVTEFALLLRSGLSNRLDLVGEQPTYARAIRALQQESREAPRGV
jgi:multimeric flavodoxin WrbA